MYVVLLVRTLRSSDSARKSTTIFTAMIIFCFVISLSPVPTPSPRPCYYGVCSECISSVSIDYLASVMWLYLETAFSPALATAKRPASEQCTGELVCAAAGTCTVRTVWSCVVLCTISTIAHLAVGHQQPVTGDWTQCKLCVRRVSAADTLAYISPLLSRRCCVCFFGIFRPFCPF